MQEALQHYSRARAIIDYVSGASLADQAELDVNRVAVYLNLAAVRLSLKQYRQASQDCTKALELQPGNVKALLRRAKAFMYLHEYAVSLLTRSRLLPTMQCKAQARNSYAYAICQFTTWYKQCASIYHLLRSGIWYMPEVLQACASENKWSAQR